jgi:phage terminase small subunit
VTNDTELTIQQQRFIDEYLSDPDRNATLAARRAGYAFDSAAGTASRMLKMPKIQAIIKERQGRVMEAFGITEVRILQELAKIGFSNIQDFAPIMEEGRSIRDIPREHAAAIKEITIEQTDNGQFSTKKSKFSLSDKRQALIDMGKHLGMFKEKIEHSGTFSFAKLVEDSMIEVDQPELTLLEAPEEEETE